MMAQISGTKELGVQIFLPRQFVANGQRSAFALRRLRDNLIPNPLVLVHGIAAHGHPMIRAGIAADLPVKFARIYLDMWRSSLLRSSNLSDKLGSEFV
ncbi:MAG: hypothetical protein AB7E05_07835 [Sphingobium sp.]